MNKYKLLLVASCFFATASLYGTEEELNKRTEEKLYEEIDYLTGLGDEACHGVTQGKPIDQLFIDTFSSLVAALTQDNPELTGDCECFFNKVGQILIDVVSFSDATDCYTKWWVFEYNDTPINQSDRAAFNDLVLDTSDLVLLQARGLIWAGHDDWKLRLLFFWLYVHSYSRCFADPSVSKKQPLSVPIFEFVEQWLNKLYERAARGDDFGEFFLVEACGPAAVEKAIRSNRELKVRLFYDEVRLFVDRGDVAELNAFLQEQLALINQRIHDQQRLRETMVRLAQAPSGEGSGGGGGGGAGAAADGEG